MKIDETLCIGCGTCSDKCISGAISIVTNKTAYIDPYICVECEVCMEACPVEAITFDIIGRMDL